MPIQRPNSESGGTRGGRCLTRAVPPELRRNPTPRPRQPPRLQVLPLQKLPPPSTSKDPIKIDPITCAHSFPRLWNPISHLDAKNIPVATGCESEYTCIRLVRALKVRGCPFELGEVRTDQVSTYSCGQHNYSEISSKQVEIQNKARANFSVFFSLFCVSPRIKVE